MEVILMATDDNDFSEDLIFKDFNSIRNGTFRSLFSLSEKEFFEQNITFSDLILETVYQNYLDDISSNTHKSPFSFATAFNLRNPPIGVMLQIARTTHQEIAELKVDITEELKKKYPNLNQFTRIKCAESDFEIFGKSINHNRRFRDKFRDFFDIYEAVNLSKALRERDKMAKGSASGEYLHDLANERRFDFYNRLINDSLSELNNILSKSKELVRKFRLQKNGYSLGLGKSFNQFRKEFSKLAKKLKEVIKWREQLVDLNSESKKWVDLISENRNVSKTETDFILTDEDKKNFDKLNKKIKRVQKVISTYSLGISEVEEKDAGLREKFKSKAVNVHTGKGLFNPKQRLIGKPNGETAKPVDKFPRPVWAKKPYKYIQYTKYTRWEFSY